MSGSDIKQSFTGVFVLFYRFETDMRMWCDNPCLRIIRDTSTNRASSVRIREFDDGIVYNILTDKTNLTELGHWVTT